MYAVLLWMIGLPNTALSVFTFHFSFSFFLRNRINVVIRGPYYYHSLLQQREWHKFFHRFENAKTGFPFFLLIATISPFVFVVNIISCGSS